MTPVNAPGFGVPYPPSPPLSNTSRFPSPGSPFGIICKWCCPIIQPSFLVASFSLKSGPTRHTISPVSLLMIARIFAFLASIIRLSGWKRSSPWSYHLFSPKTDILLMCIQSPPASPCRHGLRNSAFLAASSNPNWSKWSLALQLHKMFPSQSTSIILSSIRRLSEIS